MYNTYLTPVTQVQVGWQFDRLIHICLISQLVHPFQYTLFIVWSEKGQSWSVRVNMMDHVSFVSKSRLFGNVSERRSIHLRKWTI